MKDLPKEVRLALEYFADHQKTSTDIFTEMIIEFTARREHQLSPQGMLDLEMALKSMKDIIIHIK